MKLRFLLVLGALVCGWFTFPVPTVRAQGVPTFTTLHSFGLQRNGVYADGAQPRSALVPGQDGNFYGTTPFGGANGAGTVFRLTPDQVFTTLYSFDGTHGSFPQGELARGQDGSFYGTTPVGGTYGTGTAFRVTPAGTLTTLHSFGPLNTGGDSSAYVNGDGATPLGALVLALDGNFYGTTQYGGTNASGTVFRLTPDGVLTTLYSFGATGYSNTAGVFPQGALVQGSDGNLYGTTSAGGLRDAGTVFQLTTVGAVTVLHSFDPANNEGKTSVAGLAQGGDGFFYGTTEYGGTNGTGTVFRFAPDGTFATLHSFAALAGNQEGVYPLAALVRGGDGSFYGTASSGGAYGSGTVFRVAPDGTFTVLHAFDQLRRVSGGVVPSAFLVNTEGAAPKAALVVGADGSFYGTNSGGGPDYQGTAFRLAPDGTLIVQHVFGQRVPDAAPVGANDDGANPTSTLLQGQDGNFYGTTSYGGSLNEGTFFRVTPDGALTNLHSFGTSADAGAYPVGNILQGSDGSFYGITRSGGQNLYGTLYRIAPDGTLTTLHAFDQQTDAPASLALGQDGNLYGTTRGGYGMLFRLTPAGAFTILYAFPDDNTSPYGAPIQGQDGNFYGATAVAVYRLTPAGVFTILHRFDYDTEGLYPLGGLALGGDGNFYVSNNRGGGAVANGAVVRVAPDGTATVLYVFPDKGHPFGAVIQGQDGNIYGTTDLGGVNGQGSVFQITPDGTGTTLHSFSPIYPGGRANGDGYNPQGALVQGRDGRLYGTASLGGTAGTGTVFALAFNAHPAFFAGETALANGVYYLTLPGGNPFGYYGFLTDPNYLYHFDLGYEYIFDAADGNAGVYLYDFKSNGFFYTSPSFPFPYLYDFALNTVLYYYPDPNNAGHYNSDGVRYFYNFATGEIISK